jgi:hypothetical protein
MNIIFLDIDGVLNPLTAKRDASGRFGHRAFENFRLILDKLPEASVVITSTWRYEYTLPEMKAYFREVGIDPHRIVDMTPDLRCDDGMIRHYPTRDEEIRAWLGQHPGVEQFAILDDVGPEQMTGLEDDFFQTEFDEGLRYEQSLNIIKHLTRDDHNKGADMNSREGWEHEQLDSSTV